MACTAEGCHATLNRKRFVHSPVAKNACESCHHATTDVATGKVPQGQCVAAWKLARPAEELCLACHKVVTKNFAHKPVQEGKCTGCHDPHQSEHAYMLKQDPASDLCFSCHEKKDYDSKPFAHPPAKSGACILCHDAHSSWNPRLLAKTGSQLCFTCHEDVKFEVADRRHVHDPVLKDCSACHDPHASAYPAHLKKPVKDLCLGCHTRIKDLVETSDRVHGAIETEKSCTNCHTGHASDLPRLLRKPLLDGCLECHDKPVQGADGKPLANMAELLSDNPEHHGPVRRADCSSCHDPHASPNFRLLTRLYPKDFYQKGFNVEGYDLCFQCHFKELALVEEGPGVTRFQHGKVNLHYSHVHREKGRTCRACHAIHASKHPAHLVDTFEFGEWKNAPLGFEKLPDGGSCAPACHKKVAYERGSQEPVPVVK